MPSQDLTEIICVIDASGSMMSYVHDTIGGFNSMLAEQKSLPGKAVMTVCLFSTSRRFLHEGVHIQNVSQLTEKEYVTGGMTALNDAVGATIDSVGHRLANTPEHERPAKVFFAIITDGQENSSREYTHKSVLDKIKHQTDAYNWKFIFLGAGPEAFRDAQRIGITGQNVMSYDQASQSRDLYKNVSHAMASVRQSRVGHLDPNWNKPQ